MTITLYAWNTPNGRKISVALEEMAVPYVVRARQYYTRRTATPADFSRISPNNRIPAIVDPNERGGNASSVFESGAILLYLGEKYCPVLAARP